jgi:hypothetical protein
MERRQFLKATAAAVAIPVAGLPATAPLAAAEAAALPTLPPYPFQWWVSYDGEVYSEQCDTREEALRIAKECGHRFIAECQRQDYDLEIEGDAILEILYGQNEEAIGDSEFIECTREQERDLGKMVSDAVEAWARKHKIDTMAWSFGVVRNKTDLVANTELTNP